MTHSVKAFGFAKQTACCPVLSDVFIIRHWKPGPAPSLVPSLASWWLAFIKTLRRCFRALSSSGPCHTKSSPLGFLNANLYTNGVDFERWEIRTVWLGLRGGFGLGAFFCFFSFFQCCYMNGYVVVILDLDCSGQVCPWRLYVSAFAARGFR